VCLLADCVVTMGQAIQAEDGECGGGGQVGWVAWDTDDPSPAEAAARGKQPETLRQQSHLQLDSTDPAWYLYGGVPT